jgi:chromosome segregation ATPase
MNNEEKILSMLEGLTVTVGSLVTKVDTLEQGQNRLEQKVTSLDQKVASLDQKVTSLDQDVKSLDQKVTSLDQDVKSIKQDVKSLEEGQAILVAEQQKTNRRLETIENTVLKLEHRVNENIGVLHDGFVWLREKVENIHDDITDLSKRQEQQEFQIIRLDSHGKKKSG